MADTPANSTTTRPKVEMKIPCEVYSRIVGYLRPVENWHEGKRQEFSERKTFQVIETPGRKEPSR